MKDINQEMDELLKQKFQGFGEQPSNDLWNRIQGDLKPPVDNPILAKGNNFNITRNFVITGVTVVLLSLMLFFYNIKTNDSLVPTQVNGNNEGYTLPQYETHTITVTENKNNNSVENAHLMRNEATGSVFEEKNRNQHTTLKPTQSTAEILSLSNAKDLDIYSVDNKAGVLASPTANKTIGGNNNNPYSNNHSADILAKELKKNKDKNDLSNSYNLASNNLNETSVKLSNRVEKVIMDSIDGNPSLSDIRHNNINNSNQNPHEKAKKVAFTAIDDTAKNTSDGLAFRQYSDNIPSKQGPDKLVIKQSYNDLSDAQNIGHSNQIHGQEVGAKLIQSIETDGTLLDSVSNNNGGAVNINNSITDNTLVDTTLSRSLDHVSKSKINADTVRSDFLYTTNDILSSYNADTANKLPIDTVQALVKKNDTVSVRKDTVNELKNPVAQKKKTKVKEKKDVLGGSYFEINAGIGSSFRSLGNADDSLTVARKQSESPASSIHLGLAAAVKITPFMHIKLGVSWIKSEYKFNYSREYTSISSDTNTVISVIPNLDPYTGYTTMDTITKTSITTREDSKKEEAKYKEEFNYFSLPILMQLGSDNTKPISFQLAAGVSFDYLIKSSTIEADGNGSFQLTSDEPKAVYRKFGMNFETQGSIEAAIAPTIKVFAGPRIRYSITSVNKKVKERPYTIGLTAGVRMTF